ncbi:MAG: gliding motility-associated C-terminal domain-containing protein, partial [Leadbetterella sp.]
VTISEKGGPKVLTITTNKSVLCNGNESAVLSASDCNGTIEWSNTEKGKTLNVKNSGEYYAICSNDCGESALSNIIKITKDGKPNAPLIVSDKSSVCGTEKAKLSALNCIGNIEWSNKQKADSIFVGPGKYYAICKTDCGESEASNEIVISTTPVPNAPILKADQIEITASEKTTIRAEGCIGGEVIWSDNLGKGNTVEVRPGRYTAKCSTSCGESRATEIEIKTKIAPPAPRITGTDKVCAGKTTTLTASGCNNGTLRWSNNLGSSRTINVGVGNYTVTCTENGLISNPSTVFSVTPISIPSAPTLSGAKEICKSEKATISSTACVNSIIKWSVGNSTSNSIEVGAGNYTATCVNECGSSQISNSIEIKEKPAPTIPKVIASKNEICENQKVTISASGCDGTLVWSNNLGSRSTVEVGNGKFSVQCRTECGLSSPSETIDIKLIRNPVAPKISSSESVLCEQVKSITLTAEGCKDGKIVWSNEKQGTTLVVISAGDYSATCINNCSESGASNSIKIKASGTPNAPLITSDRSSVCGDEKAVLIALNCPGNTEWSTGLKKDTLKIGPGKYSAICKTSCGTSEVSNEISISTTRSSTPPSVSFVKDTVIYKNCSIQLQSTNCGGELRWSNDAVGEKITITKPGNYSATCRNSCGLSTRSNILRVVSDTTINCPETSGGTGGTEGCNLPVPSITATKRNVCTPESISLTASCSASDRVSWSTFDTLKTITVRPERTTSYTVKCINGSCTSKESAEFNITVGKPEAPEVSSSVKEVCEGGKVTLKADGCEGAIEWSSGQKGEQIEVTIRTDSKFTATCSIGNCKSDVSEELIIKVGKPSKPILSAKTTTLCSGEKVNIVASNCSGIITWSDGSKGSILTVTSATPGTRTYTAKCGSSSGDCESPNSDPISVTVSPQVSTANVLGDLKNTCPNEYVDINQSIKTEGTTANTVYEFRKSESLESAIVVNTTQVVAGTYYVFLRNELGCYSSPKAVIVKIDKCENGKLPPTNTLADIQVQISAVTNTVPVGQKIQYTVSAKNISTVAATNIVIRNPIPDGIKVDSITNGAKISKDATSINLASLNAGAEFTYTYMATVASAGKIVNVAELVSVSPGDKLEANNRSVFVINDIGTNGLIGVSKSVGDVKQVSKDIYEVPFTITILNSGGKPVSDIEIVEDLTSTFGKDVTIITEGMKASVDDPDFKVNSKFSGSGSNTNLIDKGTGTIEAGKSVTVTYVVKVDVSKSSTTKFNSSTIVFGNNRSLSDTSNSQGVDPDEDGNPMNNNEPTLVSIVTEPITSGIATSMQVIKNKKVDKVSHEITIAYVVKNTGNTDLKNVILIDSLAKVFPANVSYIMIGKPTVSDSSKLYINPNFNGKTDTRITLDVSSSILSANTSDTIFITYKANFGANPSTYYTNSYVKASTPTGRVISDKSNSGLTVNASSNEPTMIKPAVDTEVITSKVDRIIVYEGMSPNNDGLNDYFTVDIPEGTLIQSLEVYNRWGHLVWKYKAVNDDYISRIEWNGESNTGIKQGPEGLSSGTYFYLVKVQGESKVRNGFITVAK